jgi:alkanesulfonate monooxygenase SsuD/methylene tetrahydromethanopterin reductase-like flavin-dependent oxidoreductase (luciferase family)
MRVGYHLSSEEFPPAELLEQAPGAEAAGFAALTVADHYRVASGDLHVAQADTSVQHGGHEGVTQWRQGV